MGAAKLKTEDTFKTVMLSNRIETVERRRETFEALHKEKHWTYSTDTVFCNLWLESK